VKRIIVLAIALFMLPSCVELLLAASHEHCGSNKTTCLGDWDPSHTCCFYCGGRC